uniref:Zinc finger MYM-type protein 1-like n=1 Tax=Elaeis guineensis var. tenera TaxID=51953 RepID=A0A6I9R4W7_ELAGV|nr:zinc finger MYM-type protein 1-like [Elaeis guineensis]
MGIVVLKNAPRNQQMTSPKIQKDIVNACAVETVKAVIEDLDGDYFGILIDEYHDIAYKEQMALALRYVDRRGIVMEQFIGIVYIRNTSALSLKAAVDSLLSQHSLSPSYVYGQCYDRASNMQGDISSLKTLIQQENLVAFSIHCFAHQLQLTLIAVAKKIDNVTWLFNLIAMVLNVVGASFEREEDIQEDQVEKLQEALCMGELQTC